MHLFMLGGGNEAVSRLGDWLADQRFNLFSRLAVLGRVHRVAVQDAALKADQPRYLALEERQSCLKHWVWDHSSRKKPLLPVIRMGDGTLRYRSSGIELFIDEHERCPRFAVVPAE